MSKREDVLDKMTKTCTCKAISRKSIKDSISNGASSFEEVCKMTGAGSGSCKGKNCKGKIEEIIKNSMEK